MRPRKVLLVLVPTAAAASLAASTAMGALPGADYPWAQPGTALPTASCTQPPASVPIAPAPAKSTMPACAYVWAQPGTYQAPAADMQPPAWIPIVPAKTGP